MPKILIVDDEADIRKALEIYLKAEDYEIVPAGSGDEALAVLKEGGIDLVLLDIMMPGMDGITALSQLREFSNVPVILLTAKSEDTDKVLGLNVGADDYVTKPFNPAEVIARVRSQLRRYRVLGASPNIENNVFTVGGIILDENAKRVTVDGEEVSLTPAEYAILALLMRCPGHVYSTAEIAEGIWHEGAAGSRSSIAVHIRHLREKIEIDPAEPRYITVVWGQGYRMEEYHGRET